MKQWIQMSSFELVESRSAPWLAPVAAKEEAASFAIEAGARWISVGIGTAKSTADVVNELRGALSLSDGTGSNWDAVFDVFSELVSFWSAPLILGVEGLRALLQADLHLGLTTALRLDELQRAFSQAGIQFEVLYLI